jgi:protein-disulfide isomerase
MFRPFRLLAAGAVTAVMLSTAILPLQAQSFSEEQKREIEKVMRDYLLRHPEVLQEIVAELEKRQATADASRQKQAVAGQRDAIFNSRHQVTLGNPQGDVTVVEFFDYNCGFCKRALSDKLELLRTDPKLRLVMKEFPVLGQGSIEAAQVSIAANLQDPGGKKFMDFHQKLLMGRGQADRTRAIAAAREAGLDIARLERDLKDPMVRTTLEEVMSIAETLGINGTPTYVVGESIIPGAVGLDTLRERIADARKKTR